MCTVNCKCVHSFPPSSSDMNSQMLVIGSSRSDWQERARMTSIPPRAHVQFSSLSSRPCHGRAFELSLSPFCCSSWELCISFLYLVIMMTLCRWLCLPGAGSKITWVLMNHAGLSLWFWLCSTLLNTAATSSGSAKTIMNTWPALNRLVQPNAVTSYHMKWIELYLWDPRCVFMKCKRCPLFK